MITKQWNRSYLLLMAVSFFSWLGYNMASPILVEYLTGMGIGLSVAGVVSGLFAFASMASRPLSGILTDRISHRTLLIWSQTVMLISMLIYSIYPVMAVLWIFRTLHGIAFAISSTVSLVLASEYTPPKKMAEGISLFGTAQVLAMILGPGLGVVLAETIGAYACMLLSAGTGIPAAIFACMLKPEESGIRKKKEKRVRSGAEGGYRKNTIFADLIEMPVLGLSMMTASLTLMVGLGSTFLVSFAAERGIEGVSLHFTVNAAALLLIRALLAKYTRKWNLRQILIPVFLSGIFSLLCIVWSHDLTLLIISAVFKAVSYGIGQPVLQTEALRRVSAERRGAASGTIYIGGDMGQALSGMIGGVMARAWGYTVLFEIAALPLAVSLAAVLFFKKKA